MQEYPKALYTGDQTNYTMLTANNPEEEQLLRDESAVDYVDLPIREVGVAGGSESNDFITQERFELATQELVEVKASLVVANTEIEHLNSIIEAGIAENEALRQQIGQVPKTSQDADLNELTIPQLQDLAKAKGLEFKARDSKETLIKLLEVSNV